MNAYISRAIAVMLAAGSVSIVSAQVASSPAPAFAPGPVASAASDTGDDKTLVDSIVGALNADASLKDSKVAVSAEKGTVTLTGATQTRAQRDKIAEIATAQAGEGKVVNAVLDSAT